jgi:hypothetical protein
VRTWSQLTDFNQGLLPYVPLLVLGAGFAAVRLAWLRDWRGLLLAAGAVAVAAGAQVSRNWNSGCDGLQRYLVWVLPLAAGVAVAGIGPGRRLAVFAAVAVVAHAALMQVYERTGAVPASYLRHTAVAEWVLTHYPEAYPAEPEVFVERTRRHDNWPMTPVEFPVGFARPDGTVSKMLLDPASVERVATRYDVDPAYLAELRERAARETGLFYAHPPRGAVKVRPSSETP